MLRGQELQLRGAQQPQADEVAASELCCGEEAQTLATGCPFGLEPLLLPLKPGEEEHAAGSRSVGTAEDGCALPAPEDPAVEELAECQEAAGECENKAVEEGELETTGAEEQEGHGRRGKPRC